jgi:hypothetical protein
MLDGLEQEVQHQLRASAPPGSVQLPAPGIGVTINGRLPRDIDPDVVEFCDLVCLHTAADATDVASAARVRELGCPRVWLGVPANYFVRLAASKGLPAAIAEARRVARIALDTGAEVLEFNGEGESSGRTPGDWIPADPAEAIRLADLAAAIIEAALDVLAGRCLVCWTSHDMPGFRLPWPAILARVALHAPQHYPAEKGRLVGQRELEGRVAHSRGRWEAVPSLPGALLPLGARWAPYLQAWGHTPGAMAWGLVQAPWARLWAYPGSWSPAALVALRGARLLRSAVGHGHDAVARFQASAGLKADGIIGPRTEGAMGMTD